MNKIIVFEVNGLVQIGSVAQDIDIHDEIKKYPNQAFISEESILPDENEFSMGTWELNGKKIIINIEKAKKELVYKIRGFRNQQWNSYDMDRMVLERNLEDDPTNESLKDKLIQLKKRRITLKDIPNTAIPKIEACQSLEELKTIMRLCLPDK